MSLSRVAETWGTPSYVYDLADIRKAHEDLRAALPAPSRLYFSVKANPHPDVASEFARLGCLAEIASCGEAQAAVAAGFRSGEILMTGPGKSDADISAALSLGIRRFSADSPTDLDRIAALAAEHHAEARCLLRVNADTPVPGMGLSMTGTQSQFGADASWLTTAPGQFRSRPGAAVTGLHLYMGTNTADMSTLAGQFETSIRLARKLRDALGITLEEVDLGGGFGMPYARAGGRPSYDGLRSMIVPVLDSELPGWRGGQPVISFESGRYLAGGCGNLLCQVLDVKASKGRTFVVLDSGINHLGGMSGLRRIPRIVPDLITLGLTPGARAGQEMTDCAVVGPLCTPLDAWSAGVALPALLPGDVVAVPNVGAYGLTASLLAFLGHPAPAEIVMDGPDVVSATRLSLHRTVVTPPSTPRTAAWTATSRSA
jgi:diaminopimelate decarboxylase